MAGPRRNGLARVASSNKVALPDLIEIVPLTGPVTAQISVPGSKSITNRALVLGAVAAGQKTLRGALWSEDTQVMTEAIRRLGFHLTVVPDPDESCNRTVTVEGLDGTIPKSGTGEHPLELFVGNAGTAARFLAALVCLGKGTYRLHGVPRMHERPQADLFKALRQLGYQVDSSNDRLPAIIHGTGPRSAACQVSIEHSSQFASGLLLCAAKGAWRVDVTGRNDEESPYVSMTEKLVKSFPRSPSFEIEADTSSGSYFLAAALLAPDSSKISVARWPTSDWQVDSNFPSIVGLDINRDLPKFRHQTVSRHRDLGDSIMIATVLAPFSEKSVKFTDLGRLRMQECERVMALRTELTKCGTKVIETNDTLEVFPSRLHGAEIETYNDHRMAMCFAVLGFKVPGIRIRNPSCVKKTFPNFFQKLAAAPPNGLGVTILDPSKGRRLEIDDLFAE